MSIYNSSLPQLDPYTSTGGGGGGVGSAVGSALNGLAGGIPGIVGSLVGSLFSGQRGLNNANKKILEELLRQFKMNQPVRTGLQSSFLGRLPDYMRPNFPGISGNPTTDRSSLVLGKAPKGVGSFPQY